MRFVRPNLGHSSGLPLERHVATGLCMNIAHILLRDFGLGDIDQDRSTNDDSLDASPSKTPPDRSKNHRITEAIKARLRQVEARQWSDILDDMLKDIGEGQTPAREAVGPETPEKVPVQYLLDASKI